MESIEKLRDWLDYKCIRYDAYRNAIELANMHHPDELYEIADEIEREIAEKYMELPLDADGVPIHCGDRIVSETGRKDDVFLIGVSAVMTTRRDVCYDHTKVRHCKPCTLEDVLQSSGVSVAAIEDVAAEIRELLGVVE